MFRLVVRGVFWLVQLKVIDLRAELNLYDDWGGGFLNVVPRRLLGLFAVIASVEPSEADATCLLLFGRLEFFDVADLGVQHRHSEEAPEFGVLRCIGSAGTGIANYRFNCVSNRSKVHNEILVLGICGRVQQISNR